MDVLSLALAIIAILVCATLCVAHLIREVAGAVIAVRTAPIHVAIEALTELLQMWLSRRPKPKGKKPKGKKGKGKAQPEGKAQPKGKTPVVGQQPNHYEPGQVIKAEVYAVAQSGAVHVRDTARGKDPSGRLQIEEGYESQSPLDPGVRVFVRYSETVEYHDGPVQYCTYAQSDQDIW